MVDAVVRDTLLGICGPHEAQHGVVWAVGEHDIVLYDEDSLIMGRNPILVQGILTTPIWVFDWLRLYTNLGKTKSMTCTPGSTWGQMGQDAYKQW